MKKTLVVGLMAVSLGIGGPAKAQLHSSGNALESTQIMNWLTLLEMVLNAENQLRTAKAQYSMLKENGKRLGQGDLTAIRSAVFQAMSVQSQMQGMLARQQAIVGVLEQSYPSPQQLDGRFQTWQQYRTHVSRVEERNYRTMVEAGEFLDASRDGLKEDQELLNKLRQRANKASSDTQHLQMTNKLLLELIRQMHMLRAEGQGMARAEVLYRSGAMHLQHAEAAAQKDLRPRARVDMASYQRRRLAVGAGASGNAVAANGRTWVADNGNDKRTIHAPPGAEGPLRDTYVTWDSQGKPREVHRPPGTQPPTNDSYIVPTENAPMGREVQRPPGSTNVTPETYKAPTKRGEREIQRPPAPERNQEDS